MLGGAVALHADGSESFVHFRPVSSRCDHDSRASFHEPERNLPSQSACAASDQNHAPAQRWVIAHQHSSPSCSTTVAQATYRVNRQGDQGGACAKPMRGMRKPASNMPGMMLWMASMRTPVMRPRHSGGAGETHADPAPQSAVRWRKCKRAFLAGRGIPHQRRAPSLSASGFRNLLRFLGLRLIPQRQKAF